LSDAVRAQRQRAKFPQAQVAKQFGFSQSRVAKMEAGDPPVTLDLLIRALLALGAAKRTVTRTIGTARLPQAACCPTVAPIEPSKYVTIHKS
jgi:transcriptional regulator with XRE-family HTH domain